MQVPGKTESCLRKSRAKPKKKEVYKKSENIRIAAQQKDVRGKSLLGENNNNWGL